MGPAQHASVICHSMPLDIACNNVRERRTKIPAWWRGKKRSQEPALRKAHDAAACTDHHVIKHLDIHV